MTPVELVTALTAAGCWLIREGEQLRLKDPQHALTNDLRQAIREHKQALLALLSQPMLAAAPVQPTVPTRPEPLTPHYPCVVCGNTDRWEDREIWRCRRCWPPGSLAQQATPHTFPGPERSA